MKPSKIIILALATTALTACSSDDSETTPQSQQKRQISISVSEKPFATPDGASVKGLNTRGAILTTPTLNEFYMTGVYGTKPYTADKTATKTETGKWTAMTDYWPETDDMVHWYAYNTPNTPGTFNLTDADKRPYLDFTVKEEPVSQLDLLVSKTSDSWANCRGNLFFEFDHACAALRFYVKKAKNMADYSMTVSDARLCNVWKGGEFYLDDNTWILDEEKGKQNHPLYRDQGQGRTLNLNDTEYQALDSHDDPYLFLIPQSLTAWDATGTAEECYIKLTCQIVRKADNVVVFNGDAYFPFAATLAKGIQYDVNVNIGKNSLYKSDGTKIIND